MNLLAKAKNALAGRQESDDPFIAMQREMNKMFEKFSRDFNLAPAGTSDSPMADWAPRVNIAETDKEIQVTAELPGVDPKDVNVTLDDGVLTVKGEKKAEKEEKEKGYHRYELAYGSFDRSFNLPREVDEDKVEASFKNGVLNIRLPKTFEAQHSAKKIQVKNG